MYNTQITSKVYELKELILNSNEYKDVKEKEKLMEERCSNLLLRYNHLFNEYNEALRFEKYGTNPDKIQKELNKCKLELDTNEYVIAYKKAYKSMNNLLKKLQDIVFDKLIVKKSIVIE